MDQAHVMFVLIGLATGLMIAVAALVFMGERNPQPPVIVVSPPPSRNDVGCGGFLILVAMLLVALIFWLLVLA